MSWPSERKGKGSAIAALFLMCSIVFFAGCILWFVTNPSFGFGFNPSDPGKLFNPAGEPIPSTPEPDTPEPVQPTLSEALEDLQSNGCVVTERQISGFNEDQCTELEYDAFAEKAVERKLVTLHYHEENPVLIVSIGDTSFIWSPASN
ncbi:MAG: hypothetical protein NWE89_11095 [Candidatus Bathyarchaeota archaeon]|nr:hypothetical protein [Candidatus Bathyarchaeota archaeon]